jgi:hypothetical protein
MFGKATQRLFLAIALSMTATAQPPKGTPLTTSEPPDHVLFQFFFMHFGIVDGLRNKGAAPDLLDRELKVAGFTDGETNVIKEIALSSYRESERFRAEGERIMKPLREKASVNGQGMDSASRAIANDLDTRARSITEADMDRLRIALGPARFQKLLDYIKETEGPRISHVVLPTKGPSK